MDHATRNSQAAWNAYVDVEYGLLQAICAGEWYDGEIDWEWSILIEHLHDEDLGDSRVGLLALLDQVLAARRHTPTNEPLLIGCLTEIANELRGLGAHHAVDGW